MSFVSTDSNDNIVDIAPFYQNLLSLNNRLVFRDSWAKFAKFIIENERRTNVVKLSQFDLAVINYRIQTKRIFFDRWRSKYRWTIYKYKLIRKERLKSFLFYQKTLVTQKYDNRRQTWQRIAKVLVRRNQFTYLIHDLSKLLQIRFIRKCFNFWVHKLNNSKFNLRIKWKILAQKQLHRDQLLRIYSVRSVCHTRIIWFNFIDRLKQINKQNQIDILKNIEITRNDWIILSEKYCHRSIIMNLYRVQSMLKSKVVWKYFISHVLISDKQDFFLKFKTEEIIRKETKKIIYLKWQTFTKHSFVYFAEKRIEKLQNFLNIRTIWRKFSKFVLFSKLRVHLNDGLKKINERKEKIYLNNLLKMVFKRWFCSSISAKQMILCYEKAFLIFLPNIRNQSACAIQRIVRMYLKHLKDIRNLVFDKENDAIFKNVIMCNSNFFVNLSILLSPKEIPSKIWNPFLLKIAGNEVENNIKKPIRFFNDLTFPSYYNVNILLANELHYFSTDKSFPTPQIEPIIKDLDFKDSSLRITNNSFLTFHHVFVPKFSEQRIHSDVISYISVHPEFIFDLKHFHYSSSNNDELCESILIKESQFDDFSNESEKWINFDDIVFNNIRKMSFLSFPKQPKSEIKFNVANIISKEISNEMQLKDKEIKLSVNVLSLRKYTPVLLIEQDKYDHIFDDKNSHFYISIRYNFEEFLFDYSSKIKIIEIRDSVFKTINNMSIIRKRDKIVKFDTRYIFSEKCLLLPFFSKKYSLIDALFQSNSKIVFSLLQNQFDNNNLLNKNEFDNFMFIHKVIIFVYWHKISSTECVDIAKQQQAQIDKLRFINVKNRTNLLFNSNQYINAFVKRSSFTHGLLYVPKISCYITVEKMLEKELLQDFLPFAKIVTTITEFVGYIKLFNFPDFIFPISHIIENRIGFNREDSAGIAGKKIISIESKNLFNKKTFYKMYLIRNQKANFNYSITNFQIKRNRDLNLSYQISILGSYVDLFINSVNGEDFIKMGQFDFSFNRHKISKIFPFGMNAALLGSMIKLFEISIRPEDIIKSYSESLFANNTNTIQITNISIPINTYLLSNYEYLDDRSFIDCHQCYSKMFQIFSAVINAVPIVSNLPAPSTLREIANIFLTTLPPSPIKSLKTFDSLNRIETKDPKVLVDKKIIKSKVNLLFNEIRLPITSNTIGEYINIDDIFEYDDILEEIAGSFGTKELEGFKLKDDRVFVKDDLIANALLSNERKILSDIPVIPNSPQQSDLNEISEYFSGFPEILYSYAYNSTRSIIDMSFNRYVKKDDRCFVDDNFILSLASNMLFGIIVENDLPIIPNIPDPADIFEIANEFYGFCNISSKVPLSPINRFERKDDKAFFSFINANEQFSNLLISTDLPIIPNSPPRQALNDIANELLYDVSDILGYFSDLKVNKLLDYQIKSPASYITHKKTDKIARQMLIADILGDLPIVINLPLEHTIQEILIQNYCDVPFVAQDLFNFLPSSLLQFQEKDFKSKTNFAEIDSFVNNLLCKEILDQLPIVKNFGVNDISDEIITNIFYSNNTFDTFSCNLALFPKNNTFFTNQQSFDGHQRNKDFSCLDNDLINSITSVMIDSTLLNIHLTSQNQQNNHIIKRIIDNDILFINQKPIEIGSFLHISAINSYQPKDDRAFFDLRVFHDFSDKMFSNIFDSIPIDSNVLTNNEVANILNHFEDEVNFEEILYLSMIQYLPQYNLFDSYTIKDPKCLCQFKNAEIMAESMIPYSILPLEPNRFIEKDADKIIDFLNFDEVYDVLNIEGKIPRFDYIFKDDKSFIKQEYIENIYYEIFFEVFDQSPLVINKPNKNTKTEIVSTKIFNDFSDVYDIFSKVSADSLIEFQIKDDRIFWDEEVSNALTLNLIFKNSSDFPIVPNSISPSDIDGIINEFINFNDIYFSLLSAPLINDRYSRKSDKAFIFNEDVDNIVLNLLDESIYPIVRNEPSSKAINQIIDLSIINISKVCDICFYDDYALIDKFNKMGIRDAKALSSNEEADSITEELLLEVLNDIPLIKNELSNIGIRDITYYLDNELNESLLSLPFQSISFERVDDRVFLDASFADSFIQNIIFGNNFSWPIIRNSPSEEDINNITSSILNSSILSCSELFMISHKAIPILQYEEKDPKIFFSNNEADALAFEYIPKNLPIILNNFNDLDLAKILQSIKVEDSLIKITTNMTIKTNSIFTNFEMKEDKSLIDKNFNEQILWELYRELHLPIIFNTVEQLISINEVIQDFDDNFYNINNLLSFNSMSYLSPKSLVNFDKLPPQVLSDKNIIKRKTYELLQEVIIPIIPNKIENKDLQDIVCNIHSFDIDFINIDQGLERLQAIIPTERRITIDKDFVDTMIVDFYSNERIPIVENIVSNDVINEITNSLNFDLDDLLFKSGVAVKNNIFLSLGFDPKNRRISPNIDLINDLSNRFFLDSISKIPIIENKFDENVPIESTSRITLEEALLFLPKSNIGPVLEITQKEIPAQINDEFFDLLILQILNSEILNKMPLKYNVERDDLTFIRKKKNKEIKEIKNLNNNTSTFIGKVMKPPQKTQPEISNQKSVHKPSKSSYASLINSRKDDIKDTTELKYDDNSGSESEIKPGIVNIPFEKYESEDLSFFFDSDPFEN